MKLLWVHFSKILRFQKNQIYALRNWRKAVTSRSKISHGIHFWKIIWSQFLSGYSVAGGMQIGCVPMFGNQFHSRLCSILWTGFDLLCSDLGFLQFFWTLSSVLNCRSSTQTSISIMLVLFFLIHLCHSTSLFPLSSLVNLFCNGFLSPHIFSLPPKFFLHVHV